MLQTHECHLLCNLGFEGKLAAASGQRVRLAVYNPA